MIKRGEEPRFDLGGIAELMAFQCPDIERLLRQVFGIRFLSGQAEGKAIKQDVIVIDQLLEISVGHRKRLGRTEPVAKEFATALVFDDWSR